MSGLPSPRDARSDPLWLLLDQAWFRSRAAGRKTSRRSIGAAASFPVARHPGRTCQAAAWATGSVNQKVVPSPATLSAQMRPPCPWTMHFEM